MKKAYLYDILTKLEETMNSSSIDFVNDYSINNNENQYLSDLITEYADSSISIYYVDQYNYWNDHTDDCEQALLDLYDAETLKDIIKSQGLYNLCCTAGVCGQFNNIERELYDDIDNICKCLLLNYMIDNFYKFTKKDASYIDDVIDITNYNNIDRMNELLNNL